LAPKTSLLAPATGFAAEFERLAQRPPSEAELAIAQRITDGQSVWAEGLRPEALALLSVALTSAEERSVLFVSPSEPLLEDRQHRLGTRGPCETLEDACRGTHQDDGEVKAPRTVWAEPQKLDLAHLSRAFGSEGPSTIVVEDAHACGGSSFSYRPSLENLREVLARFPAATLVAQSATNGPHVAKKVSKSLGVKTFSTVKTFESSRVTDSSGQDSLSLRVSSNEQEVLAEIASTLPRPALVLCSTPAQADQVFAELQSAQVPTHRFHSGLSSSERARELVHFSLPGRRAVMVAVSAFGPQSGFAGSESGGVPDAFGHGYARQDLRSIVHFCAPCSLEQYAQELALLSSSKKNRFKWDRENDCLESESSEDDISNVSEGEPEDNGPALNDEDAGFSEKMSENRASQDRASQDRASHGRANAPRNVGIMLFDPSHLILNHALLEKKRLSPAMIDAVVGVFLNHSKDAWIGESSFDASTASRRGTHLALKFLADAGVVERTGDESRTLVGIRDLKSTATQLKKALSNLIAGDVQRLQFVEDYAQSTTCRAQTFARLLGQQTPPSDCGTCDICAPQSFEERVALESTEPRRRSPARRSSSSGRRNSRREGGNRESRQDRTPSHARPLRREA